MEKARFRPATQADCRYLAPRLRSSDLREIQAASGSTPLDALIGGLYDSSECYVAEDSDGPFCIFGVVPTPEPILGILWMLGTDRILLHRKQLLRDCRKWIDRFHESFPVLFNFVDLRNQVHIRWLEWLGCKFVHYHPSYGTEGRPFIEFAHVRTNHDCPIGFRP